MSDDDNGFFIVVLGVLAGVVAVVSWWATQAPHNRTSPLGPEGAARASWAWTHATYPITDGDGLAPTPPATARVTVGPESTPTPTTPPAPTPTPTSPPAPTPTPTSPPAPTPTPTLEPTPTVDPVAIEEQLNRIVADEPIRFESASATISDESEATLDRVVATLTGTELAIVVEGHTDNRGSPTFNQALSFDRARAVVNYLVAHGLPENLLDFEGLGDTMPVTDNDTELGRATNRRIEFRIAVPGGG